MTAAPSAHSCPADLATLGDAQEVGAVLAAEASGPVDYCEEHYQDRMNLSHSALGHLKRIYLPRVFCIRGPLYLSPDLCTWTVPTTITCLLLGGVLYFTSDQHGAVAKLLLCTLVGIAFFFSLLVGITDPGVYPRLSRGERDPLEHVTSLPLCRICGVRRPPRAAHCYTCGVCVLEHDHHCGVVGGCVGARSLRWFTLYLLTISVSACIGLYWISMSLFFPPEHTRQLQVKELVAARGRHSRSNPDGLATAGHIFLMIFVGNIVLLVGGMGLYYLYLVATDTTRREAQGKLPRAMHRHPPGGYTVWYALQKTFVTVPHSMLETGPLPVAKRDDLDPVQV